MVAGAPHIGSRRRAVACTVLASFVAALTTTLALAATASKPVAIADPKGDVTGVLDLQRASLDLASDGRLRAVITVADKLDPSAMLAKIGPPGSVCLKIWTSADADPTATPADHLVCVTAQSKDVLRASVLTQTAPGSPARTGAADVHLNSSGRSLVVRIAQSSLGRPTLLSFAVESTRPGCERVTCIDEAPDKGAVRRFRVRAG
jgi:hypothetical protein